MPLNKDEYAGMARSRYTESPPRIFNIEKGNKKDEPFSHNFDRAVDIEQGKYGYPNEIQIRNNSTNRLWLVINYTYEYQIPPLILESYPLEDEEIKTVQIKNLEDFETDDLIQLVAKKSITQDMVNRLIYEEMRGR